MAIFVSPGVYSREIDLSLYAPILATATLAVVGTATKGPINERTFISSPDQFTSIFGIPSTNHLMTYAALQFLTQGRQLWVVRVESSAHPSTAATMTLSDAGDVSDTIIITARFKGSWINGYKIAIAASIFGASYFKLLILDAKDRIVESWEKLTYLTAPTVINFDSNSNTGGSNYITVATVPAATENPGVQTVTFSGAVDGISGIIDADYIGTISGQTKTGLEMFSSQDEIDINLVAIPGQSSDAIVTALLSFAQTRGDCLAIVDPPFGLTVQQVVDWHNGAGSYTSHQALNTSYAALYWPWVQVYDTFSGTNIWVPPSGFATSVIAYTDAVADPWWAPAGLTRGRLIQALKTEYNPTQGDRDYMYSGGNAVNPIVNFQFDGITIYGQRTLQREPTALDRINVRRLLLYLRKTAATTVKYLVFEPNDPTTWRRFILLMNSALDVVKNRRGLIDYKVICDNTTNTPALIDQNTMKGRILIKPTKAAEIIEIDFEILPTGANFNDVLS